MQTVSVIIAAGGSSVRMGTPVPKVLMPLAGKPVIQWSVSLFSKMDEVLDIIIAVPESQFSVFEKLFSGFRKCKLVKGGSTRQQSVSNALKEIGCDTDFVAIHDAARPLVSEELARSVFQAAAVYGAAIPGYAPTDTLKKVEKNGNIIETVDRGLLRAVQTPQVFKREIYLDAVTSASGKGIEFTDDAAIVESRGYTCVVVEGDRRNIKITYPEDMVTAENYLSG